MFLYVCMFVGGEGGGGVGGGGVGGGGSGGVRKYNSSFVSSRNILILLLKDPSDMKPVYLPS